LPDDDQEGHAMSGYMAARLDEIDEMSDGRCPWRPVRHHLGITAFGINAFTAKAAGDRLINEHDETEPEPHEELYLVQTGRAVFELDGERLEAPAGTFVFVKPEVKRTAFAEEAGTTLVAIGATPGKAYRAIGWEVWMPVHALYAAGDYTEAADRGRELVEEYPGYPIVYYNLACCESLAGRKEEALEHLGRAIELYEQFRVSAQGDSDFEPIRDDPAFAELVRAEG
jgi:tetratricopeptide (TPR) repeat protein